MNHPELTQQALGILRNLDLFQWYVIPLFAFAIYIYYSEIAARNRKVVAAGLSLYMVHWFYEILNALFQHFAGHALWTVPGGTSFLILIGVGIELSIMFSVAGLIYSKLLPADPKVKILKINNRLLFAVCTAAFMSIVEIFLVRTPAFHWTYRWWGAIPVFITVYIPFFLAANFGYDSNPKRQKIFIGSFFIVNVVMLAVFAGILRWI